MEQRVVYDHGLPFSKELATNLDALDQRVKINKASMVLIDGAIGEGKTTLAIHVADYINKINDCEPMSLDNKHPQLSMGGADFLKHLRVCFDKKLPVCIYDEAGDFNKRGSLTRFNAMMNRTFETFRGFKIMVIVVLPSAHVLDQDLFDKAIPRLLLHAQDRGTKWGNFKGYSLYNALYIKARMKKLVVKPFAYSIVKPNFRGHFLDLDPVRSKLLDLVSTEGKLAMLRKSELEVDGLMPYSIMANKLGRSMQWCYTTVSALKLKPSRTINKVKYYNQDVLNRLQEEIEQRKENTREGARKGIKITHRKIAEKKRKAKLKEAKK